MAGRWPDSLLFACTRNAVRSPMAEALAKAHLGRRVYVDSAGVEDGEPDGLAIAAIGELGLNLAGHRPKRLDRLSDGSFDLIIALSPQARDLAAELTRAQDTDVEFWDVADPTLAEGNREQRMLAFRNTRDDLARRIRARFPVLQGFQPAR